MLKIAHLSDLHYSCVTYSPRQFFSKRWIGNLNLIFSRKKGHSEFQVESIGQLLIEEKVDIVFITGDLSTTSRPKEFQKAAAFIKRLKDHKIKTIIMPGNHDHYTKTSYRKKLFYEHFTNLDFPFLFKDEAVSLKDEKIEAVRINESWCCITLDVVIPTSLVMSTGLFSKDLEEKLISVLKKIPSSMKIMMLSHFPFFCTDSLRKRLIRRNALKRILEEFSVCIYMHGHTHNQTIANLYPELPLVLDAGSCSSVKKGSFHLLDLTKDRVDLTVVNRKDDSWKKTRKESFSFENFS